MLGGAPILVAQALALVHTAVVATWSAALYLPIALVSAALRMLLPGCDGRCDGHARFYEVKASPICDHTLICAGLSTLDVGESWLCAGLSRQRQPVPARPLRAAHLACRAL